MQHSGRTKSGSLRLPDLPTAAATYLHNCLLYNELQWGMYKTSGWGKEGISATCEQDMRRIEVLSLARGLCTITSTIYGKIWKYLYMYKKHFFLFHFKALNKHSVLITVEVAVSVFM